MGRLSQADVNHNYRFNIFNGIFAVMATNLVTPFIGVWALGLGASNMQMGLISSMPPLVGLVAMLPGAFFVDRFASKKVITGTFIFFHRLFFVLLALTPILPIHQVWFLVIVNGLMNFPGSIAGVAWQSFIAGAIPPRDRARAFAHRNRLTSLFGISITFVAGQIFRVVPAANVNALYQIFFLTAFAFALVEVWAHLQMREEQGDSGEDKPRPSGVHSFKAIISTRPFLLFCLCSLIFHFGWQMAWPLFSIYQVKVLGADETWVSIISVVNGAASFLTYGFWRRFIERKGNHLVLAVSSLGISACPFLYSLSTSILHVVAANALIGMAVAGINLALFNSLLEAVPDEGRTIYIASYTMLINLSATIAPMVGIALLNRWNIILALVVAGSLRLLGSSTFFLRCGHISRSRTKQSSQAA